jgi:hypothetical protein
MTPEEAAKKIGAHLWLPAKNGITPELYYRWHTFILNTGEVVTALEYFSTCGSGSWQGALQKHPKIFAKEYLRQIPGVPEYDRKAAEAEVREKERADWGEEEYERITALRAINKQKEDARK